MSHTQSATRQYSLRDLRPVQFGNLIRVGRDYDGGYVLPREVIERSQVLLSLGVLDDWSFEEGVITRNPGIRVTCVDGTTGIKRILIKSAQKSVDMIGYLFTLQTKKLVRNARYLSRPLEFRRFFARHELLQLMVASQPAPGAITLPALFDRVSGGRKDEWVMLKVDIEGAEYDVLPHSVDLLRNVSALIVEFHALDKRWNEFVDLVSRLKELFHIAHVHGNNFGGYIAGTEVPVAIEVTMVNKALGLAAGLPVEGKYPLVGLDMPNNWQKADLDLRFE